MLARPPVTRVEGGDLVVRTEIEAADGSAREPLEVRVPIGQADLLDPTATPNVQVLAVLAASVGEELRVEGPVDAHVAAALGIGADDTYDGPADGESVGLVFSGDVDSWAVLLDLLDEPAGDRVTHLISVRPVAAATPTGLDALATELGLELVEVQSSAFDLLGEHGGGTTVAQVGAALQVAGRMKRLVLAVDPSLDRALIGLGSGRTDVITGTADRSRMERVVRVLGSPLARRSLRVCEVDRAPGNCGRCISCSIAMTELLLDGDPEPAVGFAAPLDPDHVRHLLLPSEVGPFVTPLVEDLPPASEVLRRAWSDAWEKSNGVTPRPRWGDDAPPALAGPSLPERVAAALRATTGQPVAPCPAPLGWRSGAVALRPALDRHDEIRALAAGTADRPHAWAVVEHHIRDGARDGHQAELALALAEHHGSGPTYLPGILWAWLEPPVLDAAAVRTLLRTARARLWWRADGDLEPLRVLEAIEQGCLPLQVMPAAAARDLARDLPPALAPLVVSEDALAGLDLSSRAVARLLGPAVDHLLAGSAEHDLLTGAYR